MATALNSNTGDLQKGQYDVHNCLPNLNKAKSEGTLTETATEVTRIAPGDRT